MTAKRILFLAPQPFFQERGTPIAARMAIETLALKGGYSVELLTYHEGFDIDIPGVLHQRMWAPSWLRGIQPGISKKKLIADLFFLLAAINLLRKNRYDVIHAVEESVYMALPFSLLFGKPLIYDMDSSLTDQLTESWKMLLPFKWYLAFMEKIAIRRSSGVLAVCDALFDITQKFGARKSSTLYDVSLLSEQNQPTQESLRETIKVDHGTPIALYIGNLEKYQGIDLLVDSFAQVITKRPEAKLIVLGGNPRHIEEYTNDVHSRGLSESIFFLGPRPLSMLAAYLSQATVVVSPRTKGTNTPLKVYQYLDCGVPLVATRLPTHTQVMTDAEAFLAEPHALSFGSALSEAFADKTLADTKTVAARKLVAMRFNRKEFERVLLAFYETI